MESLKSYNSVTPSLFQLNSYPAAFQSAKRENKSQILQDLSGKHARCEQTFPLLLEGLWQKLRFYQAQVSTAVCI